MHSSSPKRISKIFRWFCKVDHYEELQGDLNELYDRRVNKYGRRKANFIYFFDVLTFFQPFVWKNPLSNFKFYNNSIMFNNYLKVAFRTMRRNKAFSLISLLSLILGFVPAILVLLYLQHELSYDGFHRKTDQIYRVLMEERNNQREITNRTVSPYLAEAIEAEFPEVQKITRLYKDDAVFTYNEKRFKEDGLLYADANVFEIFDIVFVQGNPETALTKPFSIVVTEEMAQKYFGTEDPIGKIIHNNIGWIWLVSDNPDAKDPGGEYIVTGVVKAMPTNSHFQFDFLLSLSTLHWWNMWDSDVYISNMVYTYVLLHPRVSTQSIEAKFQDLVKKYQAPAIEKKFELSYADFQKSGMYYDYKLQSISEIHLGSEGYWRGNIKLGTLGDMKNLYFLSAIAIVILIIACINFINLTTAIASNRSKEVGVRKIIGSARVQLITQFLAESIMMSLIALVASLIISYFTLPLFNYFVQTQIPFEIFIRGKVIISILMLSFFVGILAGVYPSLIMSGYKPLLAITGNRGSRRRTFNFRNVLVLFQFGISIIFLIITMMVLNQLSFMRDKSLGFNKDNVIVIHEGKYLRRGGPNRFEPFKIELLKLPNVLDVSGANGQGRFLGNGRAIQDFKIVDDPGSESVKMGVHIVSHNFFRTMGLEMVQGDMSILSNVSKGKFFNGYVLNESAVKFWGLDYPIGKELSHSYDSRLEPEILPIVGVVKDFHLESLHQEIEPLVLLILKNWTGRPNTESIYVRFKPNDVQATIGLLKDVWSDFLPDTPLEYSFLDQDLDQVYNNEERFGKLFSYFSGLALLISCLGIFGLTSYMVLRRTKEIAVRKTLGATKKDILLLLSSLYARLIFLAIIFSLPIAYYLINLWLQNFAYRVQITAGVIVSVVIIIFLIAALSIGWKTLKAVIANPVDGLRYE